MQVTERESSKLCYNVRKWARFEHSRPEFGIPSSKTGIQELLILKWLHDDIVT